VLQSNNLTQPPHNGLAESCLVPHTGSLPEIKVGHFVEKFANILPRLLDLYDDPSLSADPVWSKALSLSLTPYGGKGARSAGHMVRLDGLVSEDGQVRFTEMDFVPGGVGTVAEYLRGDDRDEFLDSFRTWYQGLPASRFLLATGSRTTLAEENQLFCAMMQERGVSILPINIDRHRLIANDEMIVRLFYRSECDHEPPTGGRYITAEPWLDSKALFALVHDNSQRKLLGKYLNQSEVDYLRQAMPETYLHSNIMRDASPWYLNMLAQGEFSSWLMKSADVETDYCWGARSVMLGVMYEGMAPARLRRAFLLGESVTDQKTLGEVPIVQRFHRSRDFRDVWATFGTASTSLSLPASSSPNTHARESTDEKHVSGRVGLYFLVDRERREVITPRFGYLTLRESPLTHGTSDSRQGAFKIV
jgi:hypothetical protein